MKAPAAISGPSLRSLFALFPPADDMPEYELVPADEVPEPYHRLLVHTHHMTVTVEAHHGDRVNVKILACRQARDSYARKILLTLAHSGQVVQFGIMRINLRCCSRAVRDGILAGKTPLGRILIQHQVLRRIRPTAFLRVFPGPALKKWFGRERSRLTWGRLAYIYCNRQPAVELLEIVAPE